MKRGNEFAVGLAVLAALALVIGGALWLSETDIKQKKAIYAARFRTIGGLGVGAPVTLRGVRVGRVEAIRLVENEWVETEFSIDREVELPERPAVISASASLFGEWGANIIPYEPLPTDPNLRNALIESDRGAATALARCHAARHRPAHRAGQPHRRRRRRHHRPHRPGLRQRRAQGHAAERAEPRRDLRTGWCGFADAQTTRIDSVSENVASTSERSPAWRRHSERRAARLDTATADHQLQDIVDNSPRLERGSPAGRRGSPVGRWRPRGQKRRAWCACSRTRTR